jgi:hypothetical protein
MGLDQRRLSPSRNVKLKGITMNRFSDLLTLIEGDTSLRMLELSGKRREIIIEALRIAAAGVLPDIPHASSVERKIVGKLVTDLLAAGFPLSVNDGEEITVKKSTNPNEIYAALSSTDQDYLVVHTKGNPWIRLVWGNDHDVISDYLTSLNSYIEPVEEFAEKLRSGAC